MMVCYEGALLVNHEGVLVVGQEGVLVTKKEGTSTVTVKRYHMRQKWWDSG